VPGVAEASGAGPSGGGMAVPPDSALVGSSALGDTGSLDDAGLPGSGGAPSDGTSLGEDAPAPGHTLTGGASAHPQAGGLSGSGTVGGAPIGSANTGMGSSDL